MSRRVVITGTGVVHALGKGTPDFWNAIKEGKNGLTGITKFDCSRISTKVASEITDFDPSLYFEKKEAKRLDLFTQYAIAASCMAINESGIDVKKEDPFRLGVLIGSGIGGILTLEDQKQILMEKGPQRISPFFIPMMIANMKQAAATTVSKVLMNVVTAFSTANMQLATLSTRFAGAWRM